MVLVGSGLVERPPFSAEIQFNEEGAPVQEETQPEEVPVEEEPEEGLSLEEEPKEEPPSRKVPVKEVSAEKLSVQEMPIKEAAWEKIQPAQEAPVKEKPLVEISPAEEETLLEEMKSAEDEVSFVCRIFWGEQERIGIHPGCDAGWEIAVCRINGASCDYEQMQGWILVSEDVLWSGINRVEAAVCTAGGKIVKMPEIHCLKTQEGCVILSL